METGEQHSARGGLSLLLLMLGVIGCEPPQSESPDATANSVEPGALPAMTVGAGPEQDKGFLEWCQDTAAPDEVRDITPLAELTGLEDLNLSYNQIRDVQPLAGLHRLQNLRLINNEVADVTPLAGLTDLVTLWLNGNRITDVSSLATLTRVVPPNFPSCSF